MHGRMKSPNASKQAIEFNPSRSGKANFNRPGTGPGYKNTDPGSIFAVLRVPSIVCPLRSADTKSKIVQKDSAQLA